MHDTPTPQFPALDLPQSESVPAEFTADVFAEWIEGATISKRSVPIYGKPGLFAEYEELEREAQRAEALAKAGQELAGSGLARIEARMVELHEEWMASKSTWTVHALSGEQYDQARAGDPDAGIPALTEPTRPTEPTEPEAPPANADEVKKRAHTVAQQRYAQEKAQYDDALARYQSEAQEFVDELNLRLISAAVERVEFADGRVITSISVEQLRALKDRLGERQIVALMSAVRLAGLQEPEIPAPFSRSTSESPPTS